MVPHPQPGQSEHFSPSVSVLLLCAVLCSPPLHSVSTMCQSPGPWPALRAQLFSPCLQGRPDLDGGVCPQEHTVLTIGFILQMGKLRSMNYISIKLFSFAGRGVGGGKQPQTICKQVGWLCSNKALLQKKKWISNFMLIT